MLCSISWKQYISLCESNLEGNWRFLKDRNVSVCKNYHQNEIINSSHNSKAEIVQFIAFVSLWTISSIEEKKRKKKCF